MIGGGFVDGAETVSDSGTRMPLASGEVMNQQLPDEVPPLVRVRRWLRAALAPFPEEVLGDVLLVCTELVSNAYDHARGPRDVRLAMKRGERVVRIEVDDASPQTLPALGRSSLGMFRGRGLVLVEQIATRWGVLAGTEHKTVWAEFSLGAARNSA